MVDDLAFMKRYYADGNLAEPVISSPLCLLTQSATRPMEKALPGADHLIREDPLIEATNLPGVKTLVLSRAAIAYVDRRQWLPFRKLAPPRA